MSAEQPQSSSARRYVLLAAKLSVSIALLAVLFSRIDVGTLWDKARLASLPWLLAALRDHPELQAALWKEFGSPGVTMLEQTLRAEGRDAADAALDANATMTLIIGASMIVELLGDSNSGVAERLPDLVRLASRR